MDKFTQWMVKFFTVVFAIVGGCIKGAKMLGKAVRPLWNGLCRFARKCAPMAVKAGAVIGGGLCTVGAWLVKPWKNRKFRIAALCTLVLCCLAVVACVCLSRMDNDGPSVNSARKTTVTTTNSTNSKVTSKPTAMPKPTAAPKKTEKICSTCGGTGNCKTCDGDSFCTKCGGFGEEDCSSCMWGECSRCDGEGFTGYGSSERMCTSCRGSGHCKKCGGLSTLMCSSCGGGYWCKTCGGSGNCKSCDGEGYRR